MCRRCDLRDEIIDLLHEKTEGPQDGYRTILDVLSALCVLNELPIAETAEDFKRDFLIFAEYYRKQVEEGEGETRQ